MLKYIFMDINPYVLDLDKVYSIVWERYFEYLKNDDKKISLSSTMEDLSQHYKDFIKHRQELIQQMGEEKHKVFAKDVDKLFVVTLNEYTKKTPLNPNLLRFFDDALENNTQIVLVTSNKMLSNIDSLYEFPQNVVVELIDNDSYLVAKYLVDYASENNFTYEEVACISQVPETIEDLLANNVFIVTMSDDKDVLNGGGLVIESVDDLDYSNISYNFFSKTSDEEDL